MKKSAKIRKELKDAFLTPTIKQKEAYGRFCHTLTVAAIAGVLTVLHLDSELTWYIASRAIALTSGALILFVIGAVLSKGE